MRGVAPRAQRGAQTEERVLSQRELNRALLARQLLLERAALPVPRAVERLCALQAQYSPSPYIALWSRLEGFQRDAVTRALETRSVVKSTLFRVTLHILSAGDFPAMAAMWVNARRTMIARVTPEEFDDFGRRVLAVATQRPLRHAELVDLVPEIPERTGSGWLVRTLAPLVHVPPSGTWGFHGTPQLVAAQTWLGGEIPSPEAGSELFVRRYLEAFGPATRDDLIRFAAVRVRDVAPGLAALEPQLRRFRDEAGRVLLDLDGLPLPDADTPAPVRFLPKWDSALLAYAPAERTRILPEQFRKTVIKVNGDVLPTFLVDGVVAGVWSAERKRDAAALSLEPFAPLPAAIRGELRDEGERLLRFIAPDATSYRVA